MKKALLFSALTLPLAAQTPLVCAGDPLPPFIENPSLISGQATCFHDLINGSSNLKLVVSENSHLHWSRLSLLENDTLEFQFLDGANVVLNQLNGRRSLLRGSVLAPGGTLGLIAPSSTMSFQDSSRIEARSLLLSNHALPNPGAFLEGGNYQLTSDQSDRLTLRGTFATTADLIVTSSGILTASNASFTSSSGSVSVAAGNDLRIEPASSRLVANQSQNSSLISLNAPIKARDSIEIEATRQIILGNALSTTSPRGRIYIKVGQDGLIESQGSPLPVTGFLTLSGPVGDSVTFIEPNEGDNASSAVPSMSQLPTLKRGTRKAKYKSAPVHVRSGRKTTTTRAASTRKIALKKPGKIALRSSSFFGLRSRSPK